MLTSLSNDLDNINGELYETTSFNNWADYGIDGYPLGWTRGYYAASEGNTPTSATVLSNYIRTVKVSGIGGKYAPSNDIISFVASAPSPYAIAVFEWNNGSYIGKHGDMNSTNSTATQSIEVNHTPGHTYTFSVGKFENGDSADYVEDEDFLSGIIITEYKNKLLSIETSITETENTVDNMQSNLNDALDSLNNLNTLKLSDKLYENTLFNNWASIGTVTNPSGWLKGYVAASTGESVGGSGVAPYYIRSLFSGDSRTGGSYMPDDSVVYFTASAPDTYAIAVFEYDETGAYLLRHGVQDSRSDNATNDVTVQHTSGHTYIFSVGYFVNGDSENYISDSTFLSNIIITETRCKLGGVDAELIKTQSDIELAMDVLNTVKEFDWRHLGTINYPLGWRVGYYRASDGGIQSSSTSAICTPGTMYIPSANVKEFTVKAPDGYSVCVHEYSFDNGFQRSVGGIGSTTSTIYPQITIEPNENCYYKFSIGFFTNSDAGEYLNSEFIDQILFTETYFAGEKNKETKHLNILLFGNSYFADSWAYVPFILKKYGITCNIHFYYRGSGSVDRLVAEWEDSTTSGLDDFGKGHVRKYAHIDTRYQKAWENGSSTIIFSPKQVLEKVNNNPNFNCWDIIVMSAGSRSQSFTVAPGNGDPRQGAEPYIRQAINLINASYNKPYHLGWFGAYTSIDGYEGNASKGYPAISGTSMDNRIGVLKSTEAIMSAEPFDIIFPAGTAVFNARTNTSLASTSLSATGNLWCADKVHLHAGIPNYIANCAVVQSIFKKFYPQLSIIGDDTRITDALISSYSCPFITSWCGNVMDNTELLYELDVLVDGPFVQNLRDPDLLFRGSSNQRLIDVQSSLYEGKVVLWKPDVLIG